MAKEAWPSFVRKAFYDTWVDYQGENEFNVDEFAHRWGDYGIMAFKQALANGQGREKIFAMFGLGYLVPQEAKGMLVPFLTSSDSMQRWASIIVLGKLKEEQSFSLLQKLLLENIEYQPLHNSDTEKHLNDAINDAIALSSREISWTELAGTAVIEAWKAQRDYDADYEWYLMQRKSICTIFGIWGDSRSIPPLTQALITTHTFEQQRRVPDKFQRDWCILQMHLAYALGQLEAWNALENIPFIPQIHRLMQLYMIFGLLQLRRYLYLFNLEIIMYEVDEEKILSLFKMHFSPSQKEEEAFRDQFWTLDGINQLDFLYH